MRIGLISDTHGKLRNEVFRHFEGVDHIIHAGDIGPADILTALSAVAPVTAVRGNTDNADDHIGVGDSATLEAAGRTILVVHGHLVGVPTPALLDRAHTGADIVVFGHTHKPAFERIGKRLFLNPGSAGQARFQLRPSIAILSLEDGTEDFRLITI